MRRGRLVYEDDMIIVEVIKDEDLEMIVYDVLKRFNRPVYLRELLEALRGYAAKYRVKKALRELMKRKLVTMYPDGRIGVTGLPFIKIKRRGKHPVIIVD